MNKKFIICVILACAASLIFIFVSIKLYDKYRYDHATIDIKYYDYVDNKDDSYVKLEVYKDYSIRDIIKSINGKLIDGNQKINTDELGEKNVSYQYINDENIKLDINVKVKVVDSEAPLLYSYDRKTVYVGSKDELKNELFCGDNYDDKPKCSIEGNYDLNEAGVYPITLKGEDSSHNKSEKKINLVVREKSKNDSSNTSSSKGSITGTNFNYYKDMYTSSNSILGIDVSYWQDDIDFEKVKAAGVNFVMIRVGYQKGFKGEYAEDKKFKEYIEGFNKVGIPVGIYFFSYAHSKSEALREAKWTVNKIKKYKVDFPVVFDWENWNMYNEFNLSFYHLTEIANTYMNYIEKAGYTPMLYSSKNYLENIWMNKDYDTWLAHYTANTDYKGDFRMWQISEKGIVDGIDNNNVDIDIYFRKK